MDLKLHFAAHPSEEDLEAYALNRLDPERIPSFEVHLFACETCQDSIAGVDELVATMKLVAHHQNQHLNPQTSQQLDYATVKARIEEATRNRLRPAKKVSVISVPPRNGPFPSLAALFQMPKLAVPLAMAVAAVALLLVTRPGTPEVLTPVSLASYRGDSAKMAHTPAGQPLDLAIEGAYLELRTGFGVELVDEFGQVMWRGKLSAAADGHFSAQVAEKLSAGMYWVRLYDLNAKMIQEYGLRLD